MTGIGLRGHDSPGEETSIGRFAERMGRAKR